MVMQEMSSLLNAPVSLGKVLRCMRKLSVANLLELSLL